MVWRMGFLKLRPDQEAKVMFDTVYQRVLQSSENLKSKTKRGSPSSWSVPIKVVKIDVTASDITPSNICEQVFKTGLTLIAVGA